MLKSTLIFCLLMTAGLCAQDRVDVTPVAPTSKDSLHFSLFNYDNCCCTDYYYNSVYVQDTMIVLSYEADLAPCTICRCLVPGSTTTFSGGPFPAGHYAVYKLQNVYCAPGEICPYGIAAPVRVGEITITEAQAGGNDTVIVQPVAPTDKDSLTLTLLFRGRHCCITQYYNKTLNVSDTIITLSYQASDSNCELVNCPAGGQTSFSSGPLAAGTYAVYMAESPYCPGPICPLMIIYERVGQVTVSRASGVEKAALSAADPVTLSPNPFNASVTLAFSNPGQKADLLIFSVDGRQVGSFLNITGEKVSWNAQGMPGGVYMLKARINGLMVTRKLLLVR